MNYLIFHLIFILPPVTILYYLNSEISAGKEKNIITGILLMILLAVIYTAPWDGYLISQGVWFYGEGVVSSYVFGIPLGELLFFVLQTMGVGLWLYLVGFDYPDIGQPDIFSNIEYSIPFLLITLIGTSFLSLGKGNLYYLGAILVWTGPVFVLQWMYGGNILLSQKEKLLKAVTVPTLYLCIIDRIAIENNLWTINEATRTGIELLGLPIEEAIFFLFTNMMVVQGLILYEWTVREKPEHKLVSLLRQD